MRYQQVAEWCWPILEEQAPMTVRQLFYQLVVRQLIPNMPGAYKSLDGHLVTCRDRSLLDWRLFVDQRTTYRNIPRPGWDGLEDYTRCVIDSYERDPLQGQQHYVEVWIEKEALARTVNNALADLQAPIVALGGFSTYTEWRKARERVRGGTILYFGDFDPTGLDITRDIEERVGDVVKLERRAITPEQIVTHNLQGAALPVKQGDARAKGFIAKYGTFCWELDSLPAPVLRTIVREAFEETLDMSKVEEAKALQEQEREELAKRLEEKQS